jgi:CO/xanthine dehydrogenase FAD-binding subunit
VPWLTRGATPPAVIDLSRVAELAAVDLESDGGVDVLRVGARVTYTRAIEELAGELPGLALAARTIAARQLRNRATLGGALVLADPSSDALAALGAAGAEVELVSATGGIRRVRAIDFVRGPGDPDLRPDELLVALRVPRARGPVAFAKVGARNAMARAVCAVAVELDVAARSVAICVAGVGPRAVRATRAETLATAAWDALAQPPHAPLAAVLVAVRGVVDPGADDARASAGHRRRVAGVLAGRALARAFAEVSTWSR